MTDFNRTSTDLEYKPSIVVFAYSFEHKKTTDFLYVLHEFGFRKVLVLGAPRLELSLSTSAERQALNRESKLEKTSLICERLGYSFREIKHDDVDEISRCRDKFDKGCSLAIISGARIISRSVISLFSDGIVNFHPGSIPETSGLDSFYWMIEKKALPGTTVHFIDQRVDAGDLIFFHHLQLDQFDEPSTLRQLLYSNQIDALRRFLRNLHFDPNFCVNEIVRDSKNAPMTERQKEAAMAKYNEWASMVVHFQESVSQCYKAIVSDDLAAFKSCFVDSMLHFKNNHGRTMLAEAAYCHSGQIMSYLIDAGADVNAQNDRGTTILMYAKTRYLRMHQEREFSIIKRLVDSGADKASADIYGRTILDYIPVDAVLLRDSLS